MDKEILYKVSKEYVDIVNILRKEYINYIHESKDKIYVECDLFNFLLAQKDFKTVKEKKIIWRNFKWLCCDKDNNRFTKNVTIKNEKSRKFVIEMSPMDTLNVLKE